VLPGDLREHQCPVEPNSLGRSRLSMKILMTARQCRRMADKVLVAESLWEDVGVTSDWVSRRNRCRRSKKETEADVMS
jgi:hypothetical protein